MPFVKVRYGMDEERIFNPNCLSAVFLSHIKKTCVNPSENNIESIDLANENGEVMDLASKPKEVAKKFLEERAYYILVKVVEESEDSSTSYIPLLERAGIENLKFSLLNSKGGRGAKAKQFERARLEKEKAERARENKMIESASSLNINIDNKERALKKVPTSVFKKGK